MERENLLSRYGTAAERVERAAESLRQGRGILLVDDENRENEGDLIFAATNMTVEQMALMIRRCSGIVCLCLTEERVRQLDLPPMSTVNTSRYGTAFTVSIEAAEGITTGVSAADRIRTIRTAVAPDARPESLARPGHVFPLAARSGGVLERGSGIVEILKQIARLWQTDRRQLLWAGEQVASTLLRNRTPGSKEPDRELLHRGFRLYRRQFDAVWGGFGPAPKFPAAHNLLFLMRYAGAEQEPHALRMAETTLRAMDRGGIHDQFGGGFSRYSTDEKWLVPHFEKMLYDNALLLMAYVYACQLTGMENYADTARRTAEGCFGVQVMNFSIARFSSSMACWSPLSTASVRQWSM